MLSKIKVYGRLAKFLGERTFDAEITTPIHAFKFLLANYPHLERHMMEQSYCVKVGNYEIDETELFNPKGQEEIKIVPVITGAIDRVFKGIGRVLTGAAIVAGVALLGPASVGFSGLTFGIKAGATATLGASLAAAAGNFGIFMALSGVSQMISPTPTPPGVSDDPQTQNFSFSGVQNTSRAGIAIPVVYGEIFTGSLVVSAGIDTEDITGNT
tara:strand:+ start:815 stop:1453 length:639 start_codon:yes stop_codon:yes gene_type:complete